MYAVVKFVCDGSYSEIPQKWLCSDDNGYCWWPVKSRNATTLMIKNADVDESTWQKFQVDVERLNCLTLDKARKVSIDASYTSNDETLEHTGRGHRVRVARNFSSSSEEERELSPPPTLKRHSHSQSSEVSLPQKKAKTNVNVSSDVDLGPIIVANPKPWSTSDVDVNRREKTASSTARSSPLTDDTVTISSSGGSSENTAVSLDKLLFICTDLRLKVCCILKKLESVQKEKANCLAVEEKLKLYLPVDDQQKLNNLEKFLDNEEGKLTVLDYLKQTGGRNSKDLVTRILSRVFKNSFATSCSWLGLRNNIRICDLKIVNVIKAAVLSEFQIKDRELERTVSEWFRLAKLRLSREHNNRKSNTPSETEASTT